MGLDGKEGAKLLKAFYANHDTASSCRASSLSRTSTHDTRVHAFQFTISFLVLSPSTTTTAANGDDDSEPNCGRYRGAFEFTTTSGKRMDLTERRITVLACRQVSRDGTHTSRFSVALVLDPACKKTIDQRLFKWEDDGFYIREHGAVFHALYYATWLAISVWDNAWTQCLGHLDEAFPTKVLNLLVSPRLLLTVVPMLIVERHSEPKEQRNKYIHHNAFHQQQQQ